MQDKDLIIDVLRDIQKSAEEKGQTQIAAKAREAISTAKVETAAAECVRVRLERLVRVAVASAVEPTTGPCRS